MGKKSKAPAAPCILVDRKRGPGYGFVPFSVHRSGYAHIHAYEQEHGPVPKGMLVRHTCDVRNCREPSHLVLGTHTDNMRDKVERGRGVYQVMRGAANGATRHTDEVVASVKEAYFSGMRVADMPRTFGVSETQAYRYIHGTARAIPGWSQEAHHG